MAKKVGFQEKMKRSTDKDEKQEFVKYVKAYRAENGSWKYKTQVVLLNDENRKEIMG